MGTAVQNSTRNIRSLPVCNTWQPGGHCSPQPCRWEELHLLHYAVKGIWGAGGRGVCCISGLLLLYTFSFGSFAVSFDRDWLCEYIGFDLLIFLCRECNAGVFLESVQARFLKRFVIITYLCLFPRPINFSRWQELKKKNSNKTNTVFLFLMWIDCVFAFMDLLTFHCKTFSSLFKKNFFSVMKTLFLSDLFPKF